jgi:tetratricopeptide (TPR) repeat protein
MWAAGCSLAARMFAATCLWESMKLFANHAHRTAVVVTAVLLLQIPSHRAWPQQPGKKRQILSLLAAHRFQQAEAAATEYLATAPHDCSGNVLLGLALRGQGKLQPAFTAFDVAAKECPSSLAALEGASEMAYQLNLPQAKDLLTRVIAARPADETGYAMLASIDARKGDCEGAVANYSRAKTLVWGNPSALRLFAQCLINLSRAAEAIPVVSQLIALQDTTANRIALARTQETAKDRKSAMATLQPLLTGDSADPAAVLLAARLAEAENETAQAVEWFRKAIQMNPHDATAYLAFAELCFNHGAFQVGIDFMTLGLQQLPSNARLHLARGVLEEQMSNMDAALADFQEAHRLDPQLSFAQDAIGMLFSQKHDNAAALELFEKQSHIHPEDALMQYLYAEALSQADGAGQDVTEKAIAIAYKAVKLEPSYQPARDLLCVLLLRHNDLAAVIEQAKEALRRDPNDEVALYQQFRAESKLHHAEEASALLKQLQLAKAHNQEPTTKFLLEEARTP